MSIAPDKSAETGEGAWLCASGSQVCRCGAAAAARPAVGIPALFFLGAAALQGWCTGPKTFFTVSGRLHLAYEEIGCDNGIHALYVYDLSLGQPVLVYENSSLST